MKTNAAYKQRMFSTVKNNKLKIVANKLKIDRAVSKKIPEPLPGGTHDPRAFCWAFVAPPGSGKSTLMNSLICSKAKCSRVYAKAFNHIYFFVPKSSVRSLGEHHPLNKHPDDKFYDTFDIDSLEDVMERIETNAEAGETSLLVLDDIGSQLKSSRALEKAFTFLVQRRRHLRCSIMVALQVWNDMSLSARKNVSHVCFFKPSNKKEMLSVWSELLPVEKHEVKPLFDYVYDKPHQFLFANLLTGNMYKQFSLLKSNSDDDKESRREKESPKEEAR